MSKPSISLSAYMLESVPTRRWDLYLQRFLFLFFSFLATTYLFEVPVRVAFVFGYALVVTAMMLLTERYGDRLAGQRYEWAKIFLLLAIIITLLALAWRHQVNKRSYDAPLNSQVLGIWQHTA